MPISWKTVMWDVHTTKPGKHSKIEPVFSTRLIMEENFIIEVHCPKNVNSL